MDSILTCPACDGTRFRCRVLTRRISIEECLTCGLLISDISPPSNRRAEFARINVTAYHGSIGVVRRRQARHILESVAKQNIAGREWLDVGCGFGYLLHEADKAGYNIFGVEPDDTAYLEVAQSFGTERVHHGLMTNTVRPDESADVISTLDVLEHIEAGELCGFAQLIRCKLKHQGLWAIKVPSSEGLYFIAAHKLQSIAAAIVSGAIKRLWQSEYEFPHRVYFNRHSLELLLNKNGFKVIDTEYIEDVPSGTVLNRLLMDATIPEWQAYLLAPALYGIKAIERWRGKSDALLVIAQRR